MPTGEKDEPYADSLPIIISARLLGCHCQCLPNGHLGGDKGAFRVYPRISDPLSGDWQRHVLASSGYLELGMFDDAAKVLEEIAPED